MNWIKKNIIWIVAGFLIYKNWSKVGPMLGMGKTEDASAKAFDESTETEDLA